MKSYLLSFLVVVVIHSYNSAMVLDQSSLNQKLFEILDQRSQSFRLSLDDKELIRELIKSGAQIQARDRVSDERTVEYLFPINSSNLAVVSSHISKWVGYYD